MSHHSRRSVGPLPPLEILAKSEPLQAGRQACRHTAALAHTVPRSFLQSHMITKSIYHKNPLAWSNSSLALTPASLICVVLDQV